MLISDHHGATNEKGVCGGSSAMKVHSSKSMAVLREKERNDKTRPVSYVNFFCALNNTGLNCSRVRGTGK